MEPKLGKKTLQILQGQFTGLRSLLISFLKPSTELIFLISEGIYSQIWAKIVFET